MHVFPTHLFQLDKWTNFGELNSFIEYLAQMSEH